MDEFENKWPWIFSHLCEDDGTYGLGQVNLYQLTSLLDDFYEEIKQLKERVVELERQQTRLLNQNGNYCD